MDPDRPVESGSPPLLMIVGTPRSGTTLALRTLAQSPQLASVPFETHYFDLIVRVLARSGAAVRRQQAEEVVARWQLDPLIMHPIDVRTVVRGDEVDIYTLFRRMTTVLAAPLKDQYVVEKTPSNLWMWPLLERDQSARVVAVVRDPRSVVASSRSVPWSSSDVRAAWQWTLEQREILRMRSALGRRRVLVARYEDLVFDPDRFRTDVGQLIGVELSTSQSVAATKAGLYKSFEASWKSKALESPDAERVTAWRSELEADAIDLVESVCGREMRDLGYVPAGSRHRRTRSERAEGVSMRRWADERRLAAVRAADASSLSIARERVRLALSHRTSRIMELSRPAAGERA